MNRIAIKVRTSLASKVIVSTVLLSLGVVWLTGSALYSQLSDGVKQVNLETSLAEARSSFFNAQYQFLLIHVKIIFLFSVAFIIFIKDSYNHHHHYRKVQTSLKVIDHKLTLYLMVCAYPR